MDDRQAGRCVEGVCCACEKLNEETRDMAPMQSELADARDIKENGITLWAESSQAGGDRVRSRGGGGYSDRNVGR